MAASEAILVRLSPGELGDIDRVRGGMKRGPWIKALCRDAVRARDAFGGGCALRVVAGLPDDGGVPEVPVVTTRANGHRPGCKCLGCERLAGVVA